MAWALSWQACYQKTVRSRVSRFGSPYDDQASQAARKGQTVVCVRHGEGEMPTAVMLYIGMSLARTV